MKSKLSIRLSIRIRRLEHCAPPPLWQCRRLLRPWPPQRRPSAKAYRRSGVLARALCGVPTERNPSTHPYPGLHPGLVCRAPLGHPLESSMALPRLVEALLSAVWGQAVCAGWAGFGDRLLGGTGCWEDAKCFRDRLLGIGRLFVEITSAGTRCSPEIALCCGRCGVASRGVGGWETAGPGLT